MKKIVIFFLTIIASFILWAPLTCHADSQRVIRVCFFPLESTSSDYEEHAYHDYYYDYLQEVSQHTGWSYEYVDASYYECFSLLENQKIDLICGIDKTSARLEEMDFSTVPVINAKYKFFVLSENENIYYEDYKHFDGMTVGVLSNCSQLNAIDTLCEKQGITIPCFLCYNIAQKLLFFCLAH